MMPPGVVNDRQSMPPKRIADAHAKCQKRSCLLYIKENFECRRQTCVRMTA
jgi:hypothetical protein